MDGAFARRRETRAWNEALRAELQEFARGQMAGYKCPRKIEFLAGLPKTPSGKVKRKELRERECGAPGA